jgi:hypothetical protein
MKDKSGQKYYARTTASRAHRYLMNYKNSIATNSPYMESFRNSLKYHISSTIQYLNNLL